MFNLKPKYKVDLIEKHNAHFYTADDNPTLFPGSTTILNVIAKPHLIPWAAKMAAQRIEAYLLKHAVDRPLSAAEITALVAAGRSAHDEIRDAAADVGTRAHKAIDDLTKGLVPILTDDIKIPVQGFLDWQAQSKLKILVGDLKLIYMGGIAYGGTLDGLAEDENGRYAVVDYKTSNYLNEEYALQVASYCMAFKFTYELPYLPDGYCVRFGKTKPEVEVVKVADVERSYQAFLVAAGLYIARKWDHFEESRYVIGQAPKRRAFKKSA